MRSIAFYKRLRDLGMSEELALLAAEAFEVEVKIAVEEVLEPRRAKDRARKRSVSNSTESTESTESAPPPETKGFPDLPKNSTPDSPPKVPPSAPLTELSAELWALQPPLHRRSTKPDIRKALEAAIKRGGSPDQIVAACRAYYRRADCLKSDGEFAMGAARLLAADRWRDFLPQPKRINPAASEAATRNRIERWIELSEWSPEWGPPPNAPGCAVPASILAEYRIQAAA